VVKVAYAAVTSLRATIAINGLLHTLWPGWYVPRPVAEAVASVSADLALSSQASSLISSVLLPSDYQCASSSARVTQ